MKLPSPLALLIPSCVFLYSHASCNTDQVTEALQTFRQPKNIAFNVFGGGSSHANWVLSIVEELSMRGHSTLFVTKDSHEKFGKNFPSIETISLGDDSKYIKSFKGLTENIRQSSLASATEAILKVIGSTFEEDYRDTLELFKSRNIDVVICDHFSISCQEACTTLKIPFLVTSSIGASPDTSAPYINSNALFLRVPSILEMTFYERIHDIFIVPIKVFKRSYKLIRQQKQKFLSLGIKDPVYPPETRWKNSIKMFNTAFGFEPARPLGPLVELIGPIVPKTTVSVLTKELDHFYANHQRVAYVAFGQHAVSTESEITVLLAGLLEAYEVGEIDGIIWSTRGLGEIFPAKLVTQSNTTYEVDEFFKQGENSDILFLDWAPQTAILQHTSTTIFITHAGAGSLHEGLHAGKRLVFFPFFADQPVNSRLAEKFGLGLKVDYLGTREEAAKVIQRVAKDEDGYFQANANRFQALVQIKSKSGVNRGADLVEEVVFMHQNTVLHHRRDVKHDLPFFKAYNLDVCVFALATIGLPLFAILCLLNSWFKRDHFKKLKCQ